jgi:hypothetical protein
VLRAAMSTRDVESIQAVLMRTVEGYRPDPLLVARPAPLTAMPVQSRTLH